MEKPPSDVLAERVERLERENRRWRWGAGFALIAGLVVTVWGAQRAKETKVVEAERFLLRDENGTIRTELAMQPNEGPTMPKNPRLDLMDEGGKPRASLVLRRGGLPNLELRDQGGRPRLHLGMQFDDMVELSLGPKSGRGGLGIKTMDNNYTSLSLYGPDGTERGFLSIHRGLPELVLWNKDRDEEFRVWKLRGE
jgi:hypothetical protein